MCVTRKYFVELLLWHHNVPLGRVVSRRSLSCGEEGLTGDEPLSSSRHAREADRAVRMVAVGMTYRLWLVPAALANKYQEHLVKS